MERKEKLEINRKKLAIIKDALDMRTGIPLVLVGEYLNGIRNGTNNLLQIAYKGKFYIDFDISDKEFSIPVYDNGTKSATDIKECSQGEVSLVKTSLSLGIVVQAIQNLIKQYNIVYLDEIDAELDSSNRMKFLDMLDRQLDILGSMQCFVITHNNCFFNSSAGLVLLPNHSIDITDDEFMQNKDVIAEF
jgi:DNA repair exonuclease SbcCD ATPase subunit